ncbi:hypothetical protein HMPREF1870_00223 [Bacteroidales bacterium KA00344]|nr:hypothetical protein HMPREF1870_00223 [Bacteroidales bacterium KA00344]
MAENCQNHLYSMRGWKNISSSNPSSHKCIYSALCRSMLGASHRSLSRLTAGTLTTSCGFHTALLKQA